MKLLLVLTVVTCCNAAKLDRAYLPPNHAATSGGSGNFLQTPVNNYQRNAGFNNGAVGNIGRANNYQKNGNYGQNAAGFEQNADGYVQNDNNFVQNDNYAQNNNGYNNFGNTEARPERPRASLDRNAAILRLDNQNDGESYAYAYETENGIVAEETGVATNGVEAQGGYSYTGDDGQVYTVRYTAGVNGFVPEGDHLPTPPPIPEEILKVLEQNARDEAAGIYDDGSYNEEKYGAANGNYNNFGNGNNYNDNNDGYNYNSNNAGNNAGNTYNNEQIGNDEDSVVTTNALFPSGARPAVRNQASVSNQGYRNQGTVVNNYLPPFERSQPTNAFNNQGTNGFNQVGNYQNQALRNQGFNPAGNYNQATRNQSYQGGNEVQKAYLPPFRRNEQNQGSQGPAYNGQNRRFGNQGAINGVTNAYLPPSNQRSPSFGRRQPSFNERNGYQY